MQLPGFFMYSNQPPFVLPNHHLLPLNPCDFLHLPLSFASLHQLWVLLLMAFPPALSGCFVQQGFLTNLLLRVSKSPLGQGTSRPAHLAFTNQRLLPRPLDIALAA